MDRGAKILWGRHARSNGTKRRSPGVHRCKKVAGAIFFRGKALCFGVAAGAIGSAFRQSVWGILREIPYGEVLTYGDIAKKMAAKLGRERMSSQAVGGAVGHNPISIIIPCHRVVGAHGSLTGFAAGIPTKLKLLQAEGVDTSKLFIPPKGTAL